MKSLGDNYRLKLHVLLLLKSKGLDWFILNITIAEMMAIT